MSDKSWSDARRYWEKRQYTEEAASLGLHVNRGRVTRLELFILKPLSIICLILTIAYFIQAAWLIGGILFVAWFLIGSVGASLHKGKRFAELARGTLPKPGEAVEPVGEVSDGELFQLSQATL